MDGWNTSFLCSGAMLVSGSVYENDLINGQLFFFSPLEAGSEQNPQRKKLVKTAHFAGSFHHILIPSVGRLYIYKPWMVDFHGKCR